jgi:hypothetical protein
MTAAVDPNVQALPSPSARRGSPYQGLVPFTEADADYFFGREREIRLIIANLFAAPLTLLYGPSGAGKSSVLHAGAVRELRKRDDVLVIPFSTWSGTDPLRELKEAVLKEAQAVADGATGLPEAGSTLEDLLRGVAEALGRTVMVILDQFEEYFQYESRRRDDTFDGEFPRAVVKMGPDVRFLLAFRDDAMARLDRFEGKVPGLFDNYLRIEHLDRAGAEAAIRLPLERWKKDESPDATPDEAEPELVNAVLVDVQSASRRDKTREDRGDVNARGAIPAPLLQVVMTRLWNTEKEQQSRRLRRETLTDLGGAEAIVKNHLDAELGRFTARERRDSLQLFEELVTASGTKIAHKPADLADMTRLPLERVEALLGMLDDLRIVRTVDKDGETAYEVYHDVLARAIQEDYLPKIHERRRRRLLLGLGAGLAVALLFIGLVGLQWLEVWNQKRIAEEQTERANTEKAKAKRERAHADGEAKKALREARRVKALLLATQARENRDSWPHCSLLLATEGARILLQDENNVPRLPLPEKELTESVNVISGRGLSGASGK